MPSLQHETARQLKSNPSGLSEEMIRQRLRKASMRVTIARIKVLQIIAMTPTSVDALSRHMFMQGEMLSVSTVYRILHELEGKGLLIREVDEDRKFTYRLRPDETMSTSCQLTCLESGQIVVFDDEALRERLGALLQLHGLADQKGSFVLKARIDMMNVPPPEKVSSSKRRGK